MDRYSLIDKITDRIDGRSGFYLSYAGRRVLIQFVLHSLYTYWSMMFILPQSVVEMVDEKCRDFLWGNKRFGKSVALVDWPSVPRFIYLRLMEG